MSKLVLFAVIGPLCLALVAGPTAGSQELVALQSASGEVAVGGEVQLAISATHLPDQNQDVNAFDLALEFDPAVIEVLEVNAAEPWSLIAALTSFDNQVGAVRAVGWRLTESGGEVMPCGDPCPLIRIRWRGISSGASTITLGANVNATAVLADGGTYVEAVWIAGVVTVGGGNSPSPTVSATGTAVPTVTASPPTASPTATATHTPTQTMPTPTPPSNLPTFPTRWPNSVWMTQVGRD